MKHYFRKSVSFFLTLVLVGLLTGCFHPSMNVTVTTFHTWEEPVTPDEMTFTFYRDDEHDEVTLEQKGYEEMVRPALALAGFVEVSDTQNPNYKAEVQITSTPFERKVTTPRYHTTQYTRRDRKTGQVIFEKEDSEYAGDVSEVLYGWHVQLHISIRDSHKLDQQGQPAVVYKTTASIESFTQSWLMRIPLMAQEALQPFPAPPQSQRTVKINLEKD